MTCLACSQSSSSSSNEESHGFHRLFCTEDVVTQDVHLHLMPSVLLPQSLDFILSRSPSPSLISIHFVPLGFAVVSNQHCSTETSFNTASLSMNSSSSRVANLQSLWTEPVAGDVVTDVLVIFSCPLIGLPTDWFQLVLQTREMMAATSFSGRTCRLLCNSVNLFATFGPLPKHVDGVTLPRMFTVTFTRYASRDHFLTNSSCHDLDSSGCAHTPSLSCLLVQS